MHKWAKQIMECVKAKVEAIGLDNFEGQNLDDLKDFTEIAKNIACFDKDYRIVEAMEKSEEGNGRARCMLDFGPYSHVCASVCIDQLEQHRAGRQNDGSWNYPTLFDLSEREAIKEYNRMWDQVANWP